MAKSGAKRGRPPAGPRGERVSDYPQTTVRLAAETRARLTTLSLLLGSAHLARHRSRDRGLRAAPARIRSEDPRAARRATRAWRLAGDVALGANGKRSRNCAQKHRAMLGQIARSALSGIMYSVLLRAIAVPLLTLTLLVAGISAPPAAQAPQTRLARAQPRGRAAAAHRHAEQPGIRRAGRSVAGLRPDVARGSAGRRRHGHGGASRPSSSRPDQPVVSVAGRLVSLNGAPTKQGNRWLLPLDFLARALGPRWTRASIFGARRAC